MEYLGAAGSAGIAFTALALVLAVWTYAWSRRRATDVVSTENERTPRAVGLAIGAALFLCFTVGRVYAFLHDEDFALVFIVAMLVAAASVFAIQVTVRIPATNASDREIWIARMYGWIFTALFALLCAVIAYDLITAGTRIDAPAYRFFLPGFALLLFAFHRLGLIHRALIRGAAKAELGPPVRDA